MLISEFFDKTADDIIRESDEYVLKSMLDTIIVRIKSALEKNKNANITLDRVLQELDKNTDTVYIDPRDDDRRNQIMSTLEQHGLSVERGSGKITIGVEGNGEKVDSEEQEKKSREQEVSRKAMDSVRKKSETGNMDL